MSDLINALVAQAKASADKLENHNEVSSGGDFEYETPPEGLTPARFIGFVEVGLREQRAFKGKEKPPAREARFWFELNGPKHTKTLDDGRVITNLISFKVTIKRNEKAAFTKLWKKMLYGRDGFTHMSQLLGEPFLVRVVHNKSKGADGTERTYANIRDDDFNWLIQAPLQEDPLTGDTTRIAVPEATAAPKMLLWDDPTIEQWNTLYIDGTKTVKNEKGEEVEVSKNWLQEDIVQNALDFQGSALEALIAGAALEGALDAPKDDPAPAPAEEAPEAAPAPAETPAEAPKQEATPVKPDAAPVDDPLAALGLK